MLAVTATTHNIRHTGKRLLRPPKASPFRDRFDPKHIIFPYVILPDILKSCKNFFNHVQRATQLLKKHKKKKNLIQVRKSIAF